MEARIKDLEALARREVGSPYSHLGMNRFSSEYEIAEHVDRAWQEAREEKERAPAEAALLKGQVEELKKRLHTLSAMQAES